MKKLLYIFLLPIMTLAFFACDYNDQFDGLDEKEVIVNTQKYEHTIAAADITAIVNGLRQNRNAADSALANTLNTDKIFSDVAPASTLIPYALKAKYFSADKGSAANVTYDFKTNREDYLTQLSTPAHIFSVSDYIAVWGADYVESLSPAKAPTAEIPKILAAAYPSAEEGDYKNVDFYYSPNEPEEDIAEVFYLKADFEGLTAGSGVAVALDGWINNDVIGAKTWECRAYSGNQYAQASANNSGTLNEIWLISPQVDLTEGLAPIFTFDVTAGYYNAACLSIQISENFNGSEAGIATATWTDVSSNFTLPTGPTGGYGTLGTAGDMDLTAYNGKKIYVAFKYTGDGTTGNPATTTFQLDNIKISDIKSTMVIEGAARQYAAYQFTGGSWKAAASTVIVLQPADYTAMGVTNLTTANASGYLPQWLSMKYPYAQEGTLRTVVYKTGTGNAFYADNYLFNDGKWTLQSQIETRTEQFVFAGWNQAALGWVFDPTITVSLPRVTGNEPHVMKFVEYVHFEMPDKWCPKGTYVNEEHYYGFNAYYSQIGYGNDRVTYGDAAIKELEGNPTEMYKLMDERTKEAMPIFARLNWPVMQTHVAGIEQLLVVKIEHYFSNSDRRFHQHTLKCIKSGTSESDPAEYEWLGMEQIPSL